ncbi:hypothetical protein [Eisenbergiella porci]|uniref:hypothetical protein n=1 Tax=Eisenbergiella porci TaxID=2652274 RepID=UPI003AB322EB
MAFKKKTWSDRMVEYAGRRKLTNVSTKQAIICDVERSEGTVSKEGDAFSSQNMNDLEQRVADGFSEVKQTTDGLIQNLAGLPTVKAGITELTFSGGNTTLTHNAGFPDTNYAAMFLCDNVRMFPRMSTNLDGNKTTLSASAVNGAGAIANLDGKYRVMWIVARST